MKENIIFVTTINMNVVQLDKNYELEKNLMDLIFILKRAIKTVYLNEVFIEIDVNVLYDIEVTKEDLINILEHNKIMMNEDFVMDEIRVAYVDHLNDYIYYHVTVIDGNYKKSKF